MMPKSKKERDRNKVNLFATAALIDDCAAGAGLESPHEYWLENLRRLVEQWIKDGATVDPAYLASRRGSSRSLFLPPEIREVLAREADRISKDTGGKVTPQRVVTMIWESYRVATRDVMGERITTAARRWRDAKPSRKEKALADLESLLEQDRSFGEIPDEDDAEVEQ